MNTRQFFSNIKAIHEGYAPSKVQDAFSNLLLTSGVALIGALVYLTLVFPGAIGGIILAGMSLFLVYKVIKCILTISKYVIKGE